MLAIFRACADYGPLESGCQASLEVWNHPAVSVTYPLVYKIFPLETQGANLPSPKLYI